MSFDGFISYSHAADGRLAPAVQRGLHRLAKPWHRRRALWIFRDQTGLAVTPALWSSIRRALNSSDHFVLMASPEAAASPWVNREIEHWVATKPVGRILPVVTDGEWRWDPATGDFDASCTAVPPALRGVFAEEPLYLDLRWARDDQQLNLRHSRFRDAIAQLAAPMHGVSKDDLEGEDVRQHRRAGRLRMAAVTSLVVLSGLALLAGVFAAQNAAQANAAVLEAQAQQREATEMRGSAARFADEAKRQEEFARIQEKRAREAAAEADRQESQARGQKGAADAASAEAARQTAYADRAAQRAREQQRVAGRQAALAAESAREMRRQEQRAKEQERLAREQQQLAASATAEAKKLQEYARLAEQDAERAAAEAARQQENAERQERVAIGRRLVNEAKAAVEEDPLTAVRMGIAAQRINPDADTRREIAGLITATRRLGAIDDVRSVMHGPGGLLATRNGSGLVTLWDVTDRVRPARLSTVGKGRTANNAAALSPDGRTLAVVRDGAATLWDVTTPARPARIATLPDERRYIAVAFAPDGRTLVTGQTAPSVESAILWDLTDRARPELLAGLGSADSSYGSGFAFSGDGHTLVVEGDVVEIWDVADRRRPVRLTVLADSTLVSGVAMSPAAPVLAVGRYQGGVLLYDLTDRTEPSPRGSVPGSATALEFSPDGRVLAVGDGESKAGLWELSEGYGPREIATVPGRNGFHSVTFSADSRTVVTSDQSDTAVLWSVAALAAPRVSADLPLDAGYLRTAWQAPDGRSAITVGRQGGAVVWDLSGKSGPSSRAVVPLAGGTPVETAAISPDGRTVAATGWPPAVRLTDLSDPAKPRETAVLDPGFSRFQVDEFSPDGRTLLITGTANAQLWDVSDRSRPIRTAELTFGDTTVGRTALSPDGRTLAVSAGNQNTMTLWDIAGATPVQLSTFAGHGGGVSTVTFSPDGLVLGTTGTDRTAILWDVRDRAAPRRLTTLTGHTGTLTALAFSGDGRTLATAGTESWALLWDITQPARPVRLGRVKLGHYRQPAVMAFGPAGNSLMVGTEFGAGASYLTWFDLSELTGLRADPAAFGCSVVGRGLTSLEWERYVPELRYRETC